MKRFPETLNELQEELAIHSKDGRDDALFRFVIMSSQVGSLAAHLSHDKLLNPMTRPYGTKEGEINDAGHAIVQLMTYCHLRGINVQEAVNSALENLRTKDFIARTAESDEIKGITAYAGMTIGIAYVDPFCKNLDKMPQNSILISVHPTNCISPYHHKLMGIVTDQGGMACHAAILAREHKIHCIVGTVNATTLLKNGDKIQMFNGKVVKVNEQ